MQNFTVAPIALIKTVFESEHIPALFTGRQTHEPALCLVAQLVKHADDDWTTSIVRAALPNDYSGDTVRELPEMITGARAKGFDEATEKRGKRPTIFQLVFASGATTFRDPSGRGFVCMPVKNGGTINAAVNSPLVSKFIRWTAFNHLRTAVSDKTLETTLATLQAHAEFDSPQFNASIRVGGDVTRAYHDLAGVDGAAIEITATGYELTPAPEWKLIRADGALSLPKPVAGPEPNFGLNGLRALINVNDRNWLLLLAFLLAAFHPTGPYACLAIEGEQGSGKSLACDFLKSIIDPTQTLRLNMPDDERNLFILAQYHHLLVFDNLSGVKNDLSDALCKLATGGGFQTRALYTDAQIVSHNATKPFAMNGISEFVKRPDLMDRTIPVHFSAMRDGNRRSEAALRGEFEQLLPHILHDLYTAVSCAIRRLPGTPEPTELRMVDIARWLTAAEPALGFEHGAFVAAMKAQQDEAQVDIATGETLFAALLAVLGLPAHQNGFEGTASELLSELELLVRGTRDRYFPTTPSQLSAKLSRLKSPLEKAGVVVEFGRNHNGRFLKLTKTTDFTPRFPQTPY